MFHFITDISLGTDHKGHVYQYNLICMWHGNLPENQRDYPLFYVSLEGIDLPPELQVIYLTFDSIGSRNETGTLERFVTTARSTNVTLDLPTNQFIVLNHLLDTTQYLKK